jgi:peptidoglycan/LPS O-acetylase OafA/YrhL
MEDTSCVWRLRCVSGAEACDPDAGVLTSAVNLGAAADSVGSSAPPRSRRVPALDGIRALAVLAVLAFHTGASWAVGGFLGVDVFFVLSGFLITGLLVTEWQTRRRISLRRFYVSRALRLMPAVLVLCAVLLVIGPLGHGPGSRAALRKGVAGTIFYVANWQQAFALLPPFQLTDHTWSLAIEEQFYLLWPVLLIVTVGVARRRSADPLGVAMALAIGLALVSAGLRFALWSGPASESRLYYGTDTRADSLLIGSALGLAYATGRLRRGRRLLPVLAPFALLTIFAAFATLHRSAAALYLGGLTAVSLTVAVLIAGVVLAPASRLARLLGVAPLVAVGRLSYGIYLWHWPVFRYLHQAELGLGWWATQLVRLSVTLGAATLSFCLLERPMMRVRRRLAS